MKPTMFPFKVDAKPHKIGNLNSNFSDVLKEKLEHFPDQIVRDLEELPQLKESKKNKKTEKEKLKERADASLGRDLSAISGGLKFLSRDHLAHFELAGNGMNRERVSKEDYKSKKDLEALYKNAFKEKPNKLFEGAEIAQLETKEEDSNLSDEDLSYVGESATWLHNANLYNRIIVLCNRF